ncbi:hypothetical protein D3C72_2001590 [compost metagenome]
MTVELFGKAWVVEDQADPLQELCPSEAAWLADILHARVGGISGSVRNYVFGAHILPASTQPLA